MKFDLDSDKCFLVKPKSIVFTRIIIILWAYVLILFACGTLFMYFTYRSVPSRLVELVIVFLILFVPCSAVFAWSAVFLRKIEMRKNWIVDAHGVRCIKDGREFSHVEWKAVKMVNYRKNRLVIVALPQSGIWSLNGVSEEDANQVKKIFRINKESSVSQA